MHPNIKVNVPLIGLMGLRSAFAAMRMWNTHLEEAIEMDDTSAIARLTVLIERVGWEIKDAVIHAPALNLQDRRILKLEGWDVKSIRGR